MVSGNADGVGCPETSVSGEMGVKNMQLFPKRQALLNLSSKTLVHCIAWEIAENLKE